VVPYPLRVNGARTAVPDATKMATARIVSELGVKAEFIEDPGRRNPRGWRSFAKPDAAGVLGYGVTEDDRQRRQRCQTRAKPV
jgi:hypothetical protein